MNNKPNNTNQIATKSQLNVKTNPTMYSPVCELATYQSRVLTHLPPMTDMLGSPSGMHCFGQLPIEISSEIKNTRFNYSSFNNAQPGISSNSRVVCMTPGTEQQPKALELKRMKFSENSTNFNKTNSQNVTDYDIEKRKQLNDQENSTQNKYPEKANKPNTLFLTGTIENILKWHKQINSYCFYEVIGRYISTEESRIQHEQIIILRDNRGPVLQVLYYPFEFPGLPEVFPGILLRCVGTLTESNKMKAIKIRLVTPEEMNAFKRINLICIKTVEKMMSAQ